MKLVRSFSLFLLILLSTGCLLGDAGKGYLTKTCTSSYENKDIKKYEVLTITHKDNKLITVEINYTYGFNGNKHVFNSFKDSNVSQINSLKKEVGVNTEILVDNEDEFIVSYTFDINKVSSKIKELYEFEDEYHIQLKQLEDRGYICK